MAIDLTANVAGSGATGSSQNKEGVAAVGRIKEVQKGEGALDQQEKKQKQALLKKYDQEEVGQEALEEIVQNVQDHVQNVQRDLQFTVDDDSGEAIVSVYDSKTKELIRQIPSDEMLKLNQYFSDNKGLLIKLKA